MSDQAQAKHAPGANPRPLSNRTKIVCTLGPSTEDDEVLRRLIEAGMDVARLNFSHGSHDYHRTNVERVRRIAAELEANVAVMVDTKGPEIRTRLNRDHQDIPVRKGERYVLTARKVDSEEGLIAFDLESLPSQVRPGSTIFVDDGLVQFVVDRIEGTEIHCTAANDGVVGERKGVNVPGIHTGLPAVTAQDREDIRFACEVGADAIAASFVCDADAVLEIRTLCEEAGRPEMTIIAKIESALALDELDEIIKASDGIMVARGDLGVEIPPYRVPGVQKRVIKKCNNAYKPVITATQMLESMRKYPRPTRAEVTDVANAVFDGTDCVMLSGETAAGAYPVEAVEMMVKVCSEAETRIRERFPFNNHGSKRDISAAASYSAVRMAERVEAVAIACPTNTGRSARIMASHRPALPIIAISPNPYVIYRTCFYWGVVGIKTQMQDDLGRICYNALKVARKSGIVKRNDLVVVTAGDPITSPITDGPGVSTNVCMIAQVF